MKTDFLKDKGDDAIAARFETFHSDNPHVYARLRTLALDLRRRGREHYGNATQGKVFSTNRKANHDPLES